MKRSHSIQSWRTELANSKRMVQAHINTFEGSSRRRVKFRIMASVWIDRSQPPFKQNINFQGNLVHFLETLTGLGPSRLALSTKYLFPCSCARPLSDSILRYMNRPCNLFIRTDRTLNFMLSLGLSADVLMNSPHSIQSWRADLASFKRMFQTHVKLIWRSPRLKVKFRVTSIWIDRLFEQSNDFQGNPVHFVKQINMSATTARRGPE